MNRMIKYGLLVTMFFMASCGDFLEPKSQSEYVPKLVKSLDELLLGEVYMGPGYSDGQFYGVLGLFDDDVAIRPDWKANASEEEKINKIRMAYTWAKNMKDEFSGYKCTKKFLDVTLFWIILMRCRDLKRKGIGSWLKLWLSGDIFIFT